MQEGKPQLTLTEGGAMIHPVGGTGPGGFVEVGYFGA